MLNSKKKLLILFSICFLFLSFTLDIVSTSGTFVQIRTLLLLLSLLASTVLFYKLLMASKNWIIKILFLLFFAPIVLVFGFFLAIDSYLNKPFFDSTCESPTSKINDSPFGCVKLKDGSLVYIGYDWNTMYIFKQTPLFGNFFKKTTICFPKSTNSAVDFRVSENETIECITE